MAWTRKWKMRARRRLRSMKRPLRRWHKRLRGRYLHWLILFVCLALVITAFVLPPDQIIAKRLGLRWHYYRILDNVFGLRCASCTLARSFSACAQGQLSRAFDYDRLGPLIFLYLILQIPYRLWSLAKAPKRLPRSAIRFQAIYTVLIMALIIADWLLVLGRRVV
jgi:hypothetical protein